MMQQRLLKAVLVARSLKRYDHKQCRSCYSSDTMVASIRGARGPGGQYHLLLEDIWAVGAFRPAILSSGPFHAGLPGGQTSWLLGL